MGVVEADSASRRDEEMGSAVDAVVGSRHTHRVSPSYTRTYNHHAATNEHGHARASLRAYSYLCARSRQFELPVGDENSDRMRVPKPQLAFTNSGCVPRPGSRRDGVGEEEECRRGKSKHSGRVEKSPQCGLYIWHFGRVG